MGMRRIVTHIQVTLSWAGPRLFVKFMHRCYLNGQSHTYEVDRYRRYREDKFQEPRRIYAFSCDEELLNLEHPYYLDEGTDSVPFWGNDPVNFIDNLSNEGGIFTDENGIIYQWERVHDEED